MSNSLVDAYRAQMAAQGTPDDRDDVLVMQDLVPFAQQNPHLLEQYPDFAKEYGQYRDAAAPSLGGEFTRALKSGTEEAGSAYAGLGALVGIPGAAGEAKTLEGEASENAPTIGTIEDISPGETGISKYLSKDALRYAISKAGSALPSMAEMVGTGLAGAAVGSAIEPGLGTVTGAAEGALEPLLGRGIIKNAIKAIVEKGVVKDATESEVAAAIRSGDQKIADLVSQEAKAIAAGRAEAVTNLANVDAMSTGGIYNETGNRKDALALGAAAALTAAPPFISLPARVARSLFPRLSAEAAQSAASDLVGKKASELLAKVGRGAEASAVGTAGVLGMEAANIVAKNLSQGKDALSADDADLKRLREAAIGGAIGSVPFAALAARSSTSIPPTELTEATPEEAAPEPATPEAVSATEPTTLDVTRAVSAMTDDQKRARLAEISQASARTPAEETELTQLTALTPRAASEPSVPPTEQPPDETSIAPPEPLAAPVDIGHRNPDISTGDGIETPAETAMIADWKKQISAQAPSLEDAGFTDQAHFDEVYAASHDREAFETTDEFLKRVYCQRAA